MTGVSVTVDTGDLTRLQQRLAKFTDGTLLRGALRAIAAEGEDATVRRLSDDKHAPDGSAWPDWSDAYARTREGHHDLLESSGDLINSIVHDSDDNQAVWGSSLGLTDKNKAYARIHQFGDASRNIPARPYLGLSADDVDAILDLLERHIDRSLR